MKKKKILLLNDTSLICHYGCTLLMNTIYNFFEKKNFIIKDKIYYEENYLKYIQKINNYDLVLINGEGTIHGKSNSDKSKVNEIIKFISLVKKKYKVPIVIFNSTIASIQKRHLKILNLVDKIYVREKYSFNYLRQNKVKSTILPDFLSLLVLKNKKKNKEIIVTDSSKIKTTQKLFGYANYKNYTYLPILYNNYLRFFRFFIIKFALKLKIVFLIEVYLSLKNLHLKNFLKKISKANHVITGRFHGIFICLALMKPFYTFESDTYKIKGLLEMIGLKKRMMNVNNINKLNLYNFNKEELLKINKFQIKLKKKYNDFIKEINDLKISK